MNETATPQWTDHLKEPVLPVVKEDEGQVVKLGTEATDPTKVEGPVDPVTGGTNG